MKTYFVPNRRFWLFVLTVSLVVFVVAAIGPFPSEAAWTAMIVAFFALVKTIERLVVYFGAAPLPEGFYQKWQMRLVGVYAIFQVIGLLPFDFDTTWLVLAVEDAPGLLNAGIAVVNVVIQFIAVLLASKAFYEVMVWAGVPLAGFSRTRELFLEANA